MSGATLLNVANFVRLNPTLPDTMDLPTRKGYLKGQFISAGVTVTRMVPKVWLGMLREDELDYALALTMLDTHQTINQPRIVLIDPEHNNQTVKHIHYG